MTTMDAGEDAQMDASDRPADAQRCPAVKRDGAVCGAKAGASGFCIGHTPHAQEARAKGGASTSRQARALRAMPPRLRPVADMLGKALQEVHDGKIDPRIASAMASLAGALVRVITAGELEERIKALEEAQATDATTDRGIA